MDHSYGGWNAPVDPSSGEFVYVPIPESRGVRFHPGCERPYAKIRHALDRFAKSVGKDLFGELRCPPDLLTQSMHLDPDYEHLTYGDDGNRRGSEIRRLSEDDFLVFYAGLRPCFPAEHRLVYAIVGLYIVKEVVNAADVPPARFNENAHTRKLKPGAADIVVRAKPLRSGRLERCIPIGEYRSGAYRVRPDLLDAWGGLSVSDGYIQRSARPSRFLRPERFLAWFERQNVGLLAANNPSRAKTRVVIVHLRRPRKSDPDEMRSDPFWEFGSFGCTGCHRKNLMHPRRIDELEGVRLAFAQGGSGEFRLVLLTPPVRVVRRSDRCELQWEREVKPFRYDQAPVLINNEGRSDFSNLKRAIRRARRGTWCGRFSSCFRSSRTPLPEDVADELIRTYERYNAEAPQEAFAGNYTDTMPYPPNNVDQYRIRTYKRLVSEAGSAMPCRRRC